VLCAACVEGANRRDGHKDKHTLTLSVRGRTLEKKKGKEAGWGKPALFVSKVPFSPIFFAQISFGKRHFSPFSPTTKRHFRRISLREKKCRFSLKKSRKAGSTQLTAQNWTIFRRISHREKYNFSPFFASQKSAIFAAFRSAKKSAIFREKFREKQARPNILVRVLFLPMCVSILIKHLRPEM
jgi:hypothetical protein